LPRVLSFVFPFKTISRITCWFIWNLSEGTIYSEFFSKFDVKASMYPVPSLLFAFILTVLENLLKFPLIHR